MLLVPLKNKTKQPCKTKKSPKHLKKEYVLPSRVVLQAGASGTLPNLHLTIRDANGDA
jgi:hypothetical protein